MQTKTFGVENYYVWRGTCVTPQYFDRLQNQGWTLKNDTDDHWDFHDAQGTLRRSEIFQDKTLNDGFRKREANFEYDDQGNLHGEQIKFAWNAEAIIQKNYQWHGHPVSKILFDMAEASADIVGIKPVNRMMNMAEKLSGQLQKQNPASPQ